MPKPNKPRPARVRPPRSAASTIAYEFDMCRRCVALWSKGIAVRPEVDCAVVQNAILEAALLHARNLLDFFIGTNNKDDVIADDFLAKGSRFRLPYLEKHRKRLHKRLAHPSYLRSRFARHWDLDAIVSEVEAAWARLRTELERVDPTRARWFGESADAPRPTTRKRKRSGSPIATDAAFVAATSPTSI